MVKPRIKFGVVATFIISGGLPLLGSVLVQLYFSDWGWAYEPLHSVVEATGALIALTVAVLLIQMRGGQDVVHFTWIASALIGMGLLDGFHSVLRVGGGFVRTHSMATLVGGILFSLIWLPEHLARTRLAKAWPRLVAAVATILGLFIVTFPDELPAMLNHDGFTPVAKAVNLSGGMFFIAAGICFLLRYQVRSRKDDLLFANQCFLFGGAGVLFANSTLWDAAWWYWHLLRLVAYLVVFGYAFSVYHRLRDELHGSEARSRALLHAIPDLIIRFHQDGTLLDFQAHDDSLNLKNPPQQMIVGDSIYESPMRREVVDQIMGASRQAVETGDAQTVEFAFPHDSELRHYEARIVASGANELVATVRNITEQKRAEESLRESEEKFRSLAESTATGIFIYQGEWLRYANPAAEVLTGYSREELLRMRFEELAPPDLREAVRERGLARLRGDPLPPRYEHKIITKQGEERWLHVAAGVTMFEGKPAGIVSAFDITERKQAEEALRQREREFRFLADNVPGLFSYVDSEQRYRFINKSYEKAHALPQEQIIGKHVREVLGDSGYELAREHIQAALSGQRVTYEAAFPLRGGLRWTIVIYVPDLDGYGKAKGFFTLVTDITERKKAEEALRLSQEELRALAGRLISAKEEESRRLARELHDVFGQKLAVLGMDLSAVEQQVPSIPDSLSKKLQQMQEQIGRLAVDIHHLSRELHPSMLNDLGLVPSLRAECQSFSRQHRIAADFISSNLPDSIPSEASLSIYRIVQESLWNVAKHSGANQVHVALSGTDEEIVLAIQDNGKGFDLDLVKGKDSLGLVSMEERARLVNGRFSLTSREREGTLVEVRIPMSAENATPLNLAVRSGA